MSIRQWYICFSISQKTEDWYSQAMEEAVKDVFEKNMHHDDTMKKIAKPYSSNWECSVQEAKYHILLKLMLRRILPVVYFFNPKSLEERVQVLVTVTGLESGTT